MSSNDDLTTRHLAELREELVEHKAETGKRFDAVDRRFDAVDDRFDSLEHRMVDSEMRLATAINGLAGTLDDVRTMLRRQQDLPDRVARCEADIAELRR